MQIIKADIMGYCMGVRRAVESAEKAIQDFPHKNISTDAILEEFAESHQR